MITIILFTPTHQQSPATTPSRVKQQPTASEPPANRKKEIGEVRRLQADAAASSLEATAPVQTSRSSADPSTSTIVRVEEVVETSLDRELMAETARAQTPPTPPPPHAAGAAQGSCVLIWGDASNHSNAAKPSQAASHRASRSVASAARPPQLEAELVETEQPTQMSLSDLGPDTPVRCVLPQRKSVAMPCRSHRPGRRSAQRLNL